MGLGKAITHAGLYSVSRSTTFVKSEECIVFVSSQTVNPWLGIGCGAVLMRR